MEKKGFTMYAHEYTLIGGKTDTFGVHVCPNHFTIMQVRDPETRLKSHLRSVGWLAGLSWSAGQMPACFNSMKDPLLCRLMS